MTLAVKIAIMRSRVMSHTYFPRVILPIKLNLQDTAYNCGPASVKIILETLGISIDEEKLMKMQKTTPKEGTSPNNLVKCLADLGIKHEVIEHASITNIEDKIRQFNLCLVDFQAWGDGGNEFKGLETGHYSVVFGFNKTHLWVADPAKHHTEKQKSWGARKIRKDLFTQRWADKEASGIKTHHWMVSVPLFQRLSKKT